MELMELLRSLMMENQVSITGFYRALQANDLDLSRFGDFLTKAKTTVKGST